MKNCRILAVLLLILALVMTGACISVEQKETEAPAETEAAETEEQKAEEEPEVPQSDTAADPAADPAPDFTVLDADGKEVRLSDLFGKPILINFWATWCPPCKAELPHFEQAFQTYGDEILFMMVDLTDGVDETEEIVQAYMEENGYTFPVYYDTELNAARAYVIQAIPQTYAIGRDGSILMKQVGSMSENELKKFTDALLSDE